MSPLPPFFVIGGVGAGEPPSPPFPPVSPSGGGALWIMSYVPLLLGLSGRVSVISMAGTSYNSLGVLTGVTSWLESGATLWLLPHISRKKYPHAQPATAVTNDTTANMTYPDVAEAVGEGLDVVEAVGEGATVIVPAAGTSTEVPRSCFASSTAMMKESSVRAFERDVTTFR